MIWLGIKKGKAPKRPNFELCLTNRFMEILHDCSDHINLDFLEYYSPDLHAAFQLRLQELYDLDFNNFCNCESFICPHCGKKLRIHDSFCRSFDFGFAQFTLKCRRTYCPRCGRSHRFLPGFTIPRFLTSSYAADKAIRAVNSGCSMAKAIALSCADPFSIRRILSMLKRLFPARFGSFSSFLDIFDTAADTCCSRLIRAVKKISGIELFKLIQ